jgi:glycerate dehydrogenase
MKIIFLDYKTLNFPLDLTELQTLGELEIRDNTPDREVGSVIADAEIIITNQNQLGEANLNQAHRLKLICAAATGYNNIDLDFCRKNGIGVTNVPDYASNSVAQHTISMLLCLISHSAYYDDYIKSTRYFADPLNAHESREFFELEGKTWGIIGLGKIGKKVGQYASGFGCRVIYHSTSGCNHSSHFQESTLEELLKTSDIVSIHAPRNSATNGLIGMRELQMMKPGSYLLNLGRGGIVDEQALADALDGRIIAGAGLDVFEEEPLPPGNPLLQYIRRNPSADHLLLTPHIGFASKEAREKLLATVCSNIRDYLNGGLLNRVDL